MRRTPPSHAALDAVTPIRPSFHGLREGLADTKPHAPIGGKTNITLSSWRKGMENPCRAGADSRIQSRMDPEVQKRLKLTMDYFDVHDDAGLLTTNPERGKVRRGGLPIFPLTTPSPSLQSVSPSCPYMGKMGPTPAMPAQQFGGSPSPSVCSVCPKREGHLDISRREREEGE